MKSVIEYVPVIAKAIAAVLTVVVAAIAADQIEVEPWVEVVFGAVLAGLAVWAVPNKEG